MGGRYVHLFAHVCMYMCSSRTDVVYFPWLVYPLFLRQGLSLHPEPISSARYLGQWTRGIHFSPCAQLPQLQVHVVPAFYIGSRDLNLGPLAYEAGTHLLGHLSSPREELSYVNNYYIYCLMQMGESRFL